MTITTSILSSYEIPSSSQEILKVLEQSYEARSSLMWQNFSSYRMVFTIQNTELKGDQKQLRLTLNGQEEKLDPKTPVYVKFPFLEMIFKGMVSEKDDSGVVLDLPSEIHMREFREHVRSHFSFGETFAVVRPHAGDLHGENIAPFKAHLIDISQIGLGLFVSESNLRHFKRGQNLQFHEINGIKLASPLMGEVAYVRKEEHPTIKKAFIYRIGIKMKKEFKPELLAKLLP